MLAGGFVVRIEVVGDHGFGQGGAEGASHGGEVGDSPDELGLLFEDAAAQEVRTSGPGSEPLRCPAKGGHPGDGPANVVETAWRRVSRSRRSRLEVASGSGRHRASIRASTSVVSQNTRAI